MSETNNTEENTRNVIPLIAAALSIILFIAIAFLGSMLMDSDTTLKVGSILRGMGIFGAAISTISYWLID